MVTKPRRVEVVIDELVLHGFAPGDRHAIGEAVRSELEALLRADSSIARQGGAIDRVAGAEARIARGAKPQAAGGAIAQSIHGGLPR